MERFRQTVQSSLPYGEVNMNTNTNINILLININILLININIYIYLFLIRNSCLQLVKQSNLLTSPWIQLLCIAMVTHRSTTLQAVLMTWLTCAACCVGICSSSVREHTHVK